MRDPAQIALALRQDSLRVYDVPTKSGRIEALPSGRFALNDETLSDGDEIELRVDLGPALFYCPCWIGCDGAGWYAQSQADPTDVWPLHGGMTARRLRARE